MTKTLLLVGGLGVIALLIYLAVKPSGSATLAIGTPAGGGAQAATDPGWGFASSLTQTLGGIVTTIAGQVSGNNHQGH